MTEEEWATELRGITVDELRRRAYDPPSDPAGRRAVVAELQRRAALTRDHGPAVPAGVRVIDIDMPFGSMVSFMVKWAIASIPAMLILFFVGFLALAFLGALGAGIAGLPKH